MSSIILFVTREIPGEIDSRQNTSKLTNTLEINCCLSGGVGVANIITRLKYFHRSNCHRVMVNFNRSSINLSGQ